MMRLIRRLHVYLGLALIPWALLYGVTAFFFNHPSVLGDYPMIDFGPADWAGTPLESRASADDVARQLCQRLNDDKRPQSPYRPEPDSARWTREFAFATVTNAEVTHSVLFDVATGRGAIRTQPTRPVPPTVPFDVSPVGGEKSAVSGGIVLDQPLRERLRAALPTIMTRRGLSADAVTVTSTPDLEFTLIVDGQPWTAHYEEKSGAVSGKPLSRDGEPMSARKFLTGLHYAHGYPYAGAARWWWAMGVDVMSFGLCFWACSGLLMWWQLKAERRGGMAMLVVSVAAAAALAVTMRSVL